MPSHGDQISSDALWMAVEREPDFFAGKCDGMILGGSPESISCLALDELDISGPTGPADTIVLTEKSSTASPST